MLVREIVNPIIDVDESRESNLKLKKLRDTSKQQLEDSKSPLESNPDNSES